MSVDLTMFSVSLLTSTDHVFLCAD